MLCIESSDITFHGTYDMVVENFSYILAAASREKINIAKINSLCNALPSLSALFCLLSVFSPHCSGWEVQVILQWHLNTAAQAAPCTEELIMQ